MKNLLFHQVLFILAVILFLGRIVFGAAFEPYNLTYGTVLCMIMGSIYLVIEEISRRSRIIVPSESAKTLLKAIEDVKAATE